jgi:single-stranded DNA-specific DHH superfamily exonuclease
MLTEKQILQIREHLDRAQNPVFFYDNDADGFCSYVLLRRFIERGRGVAVRSHPDVDENYVKRAQELNADYVFVLDRPILGSRFAEEIEKVGIPVVWIDHHDLDDEKYNNVFIFNPQLGKNKSGEPVSYWAHKIANKDEDAWISLMGCIADHYLPDFSEDFRKKHPAFWGKKSKIKEPFDAYYGTELGKLARVIGFGLKDSISHVVQMQNYLIKCRGPEDMMSDMDSSKSFANKYKEVSKRYSALLDKAKATAGKKLLFFSYGGETSMSADISNELSYLYPKHTVVVAYSNGPFTNMSLRGKNVKGLLERILKKGFENSSGGGHKDAVGARIQSADLERFKEGVEKEV